MHVEVGETIYKWRSHRELREQSVFFYNHIFYPTVGINLYGELEAIPLPPLDDVKWPLPDMHTSETFRAKFWQDFRLVMKPSTGSRVTHLQWFLSLVVFVDLFACVRNMRRTPTMFEVKNISDETFSSLMDAGWDSKVTTGEDVFRCLISRPNVTMKYHVGWQTLYTNFQFNKQCLVRNAWVDVDQDGPIDLVQVRCVFQGVMDTHFTAGRTWPLTQMRQEVKFWLGDDVPDEFTMSIAKVNVRNEKRFLVRDVLPPRLLKVLEVTDG